MRLSIWLRSRLRFTAAVLQGCRQLDHKGKGRRSLGESVCSSQYCVSHEGSYKAQQAPGKQTPAQQVPQSRPPGGQQMVSVNDIVSAV